jgi:hypothetical protein
MALSATKEEAGETFLASDGMRLTRELMSNIDDILTAIVLGPEPIEPNETRLSAGPSRATGPPSGSRPHLP